MEKGGDSKNEFQKKTSSKYNLDNNNQNIVGNVGNTKNDNNNNNKVDRRDISNNKSYNNNINIRPKHKNPEHPLRPYSSYYDCRPRNIMIQKKPLLRYDNLTYCHDGRRGDELMKGGGGHYHVHPVINNNNGIESPVKTIQPQTQNEHVGGHPVQHQRQETGRYKNRNTQFLSGCNPDHSDQQPRSKNRNDICPHRIYEEVRPNGYGNHCDVGQLHQHHNKCKPGYNGQSLGGNHPQGEGGRRKVDNKNTTGIGTPMRKGVEKPRKKLYKTQKEPANIIDVDMDVVPVGVDLEMLLINSCKINTTKVQTIIDNFMVDRKYITIFCMTETKVKGHDFQPEGIKMFSKHRNGKGEKKGGGLALGYAISANIKLEEIDVKSNDILALEGTINCTRCRIVLCYFNCNKLRHGKEFNKNRVLQKQVEDLMEVDPNTDLIVLGDMNGRLSKLEPSILLQ